MWHYFDRVKSEFHPTSETDLKSSNFFPSKFCYKLIINNICQLETFITYVKKWPTKEESKCSSQAIQQVSRIKCQQFFFMFYQSFLRRQVKWRWGCCPPVYGFLTYLAKQNFYIWIFDLYPVSYLPFQNWIFCNCTWHCSQWLWPAPTRAVCWHCSEYFGSLAPVPRWYMKICHCPWWSS